MLHSVEWDNLWLQIDRSKRLIERWVKIDGYILIYIDINIYICIYIL